MQLKEIVNSKTSFSEILELISEKDLSKKYFIVQTKKTKLSNSNTDSESLKIKQIYGKSENNIDKFLEFIKSEDGIYSTMIQRKIEKKKELPKILSNIGYIINPEETDNITKMYIPRDSVEKRMKIVLNKTLKNNILLVGHPGSGKTTIVEQFTKRNKIQNMFVVETAKLVGDSQYRGQFEQRVVDIIDFAIKEKLILFFDELHSLIDLGNSLGGMSITDILKPYLSSNKIKFIGATTKKESDILMKDEAFKRRFSVIKVEEFSNEELMMLKNNFLETFNMDHNIISTEQTSKILEKLKTDLPKQYFPDKFVDFLDYYFSFKKIEQNIVLENVLQEYIHDNQHTY